ncbi:MAG: hypothetical protein FWE41_05570 [Coriobacteriia bacterium]|nr:hypothetical protein [Coriobacteriia bacterium]MCL2749428.1 hypothetical protein [Coriobacteriia bacterium]
MKKLVTMLLVIVLSLGVLSGCNNTGANNNSSGNNTGGNNSTQGSNLSPADTVLLFAELYTARDTKGLSQILYRADEYNFDVEGFTLVSLTISIQNANAQMEDYEIEYYQDQHKDLIDTAIVCAEATYVFENNSTGTVHESAYYYDYYLIKTESHPSWRIMTWASQAWVNN